MKGRRYGGKRWVDTWGFRGYITARINPDRAEPKSRMRALKKARFLDHTRVRAVPPLIPDNGKLAVSRRLDAEHATISGLERKMRNRASTKLSENRSLKKRLIQKTGSLHSAITWYVSEHGLSLLTGKEKELMGQLLGG